MRKETLNKLICPKTGSKLEFKDNVLVNENGDEYPIINDIPVFITEDDLKKNKYAINLFKEKALEYDKYHHLSYETFYQNETSFRNSLIDKLHLKPDATVLEVNAGTGRDSVLITQRLSEKGSLHVQDISMDMLMVLKEKTANFDVPVEIHQGNAIRLPYQDRVFDAVYSFGGVGMNTYADNKDAFTEMVRVTKVGGRIVVGGLSLAPWLRKTTFGKILANHNSHYLNDIILPDIPIQARDVNLSWILSGAGFVLDFTVGEGEPVANFDYEIPGVRGGTHKTRFYGQLEGVTPETKELAMKAREKADVSMHKWLDDLVKRESLRILEEE